LANKEKLLESAQKFIAKGQFSKAIGDYQKLVEAFPKDYRFRQKLAELLTRERRSEEAQPHHEAVAKNFAETGFYLKAIAIYKQMQKVEPNRPDLYLRLAELNEKQGLIGNALTEYRSLIALHEKNKQLRETIPVLQKMAALDADNLGVRGKLIETLLACHEDDAARDQFRNLVTFLEGKGEHARIVKLYEKFQQLCADSCGDQLPLSRALLASDQADKALSLLKGLLKHDPDNAEVLGQLVDCHLALGNHEDARLTCQHLLKNHSDNLLLRERHVRICLAAGDRARAQTSLDESRDDFHRAGQMTLFAALLTEVQGGTPDQVQPSEPTPVVESFPEPSLEVPVVEPVESVTTPEVEQKSLPAVGAKAPPLVGGGIELELELDLDLLAPASTAHPVPPPVAEPAPETATAPAMTVTPAPAPTAPPATATLSSSELPQEMELELELDLGEFGIEAAGPQESVSSPTIVASPPFVETELEIASDEVVAPATLEELPVDSVEEASVRTDAGFEHGLELDLDFSSTTEFEPTPHAEFEAESTAEIQGAVEFATAEEQLLPAERPAMLSEELSLPEFGGLELVMETTAVPEPVIEAEPLPGHGEVELPEEFAASEERVEETTAAEDVEYSMETGAAPVEFDEETAAAEVPADVEDLEELEEIEEIEALEELEELEEMDEVEAVVEEQSEIFSAESMESLQASQLLEGLEEVDFYLRSGLLDDAERVATELLVKFPEQPELLTRLEEIAALRQAQPVAEESSAVAAEFAQIDEEELLGGVEAAVTEAPAVDEFSLEAPTASPEIEEDEDLQSHFDLGIAYKEMGLLDDAVTEFERAARDPARRLDCLTLKGQCQLDMGRPDAAEGTFRQALDIPLLSEEGRRVLCYELGLLYEVLGRKQEALDNYQIVANIDLFFRDVTDKLKMLRQELGIDDQAIEDVSEAVNGRDRISFV